MLGIHETGGILGFIKAASVAEAAGINVCLHGLHETGITTCAANQAGAQVGAPVRQDRPTFRAA